MPRGDWRTLDGVWLQYLIPNERGLLEELGISRPSPVDLAQALIALGRTIILIAPGKQAAELEELRPWFSAQLRTTEEAIEGMNWMRGAIDKRKLLMQEEGVDSWDDLSESVPASTVVLIEGTSLMPATPPRWGPEVSPDGVRMLIVENERKVELRLLVNLVAVEGPAVGFTTIIKERAHLKWNCSSAGKRTPTRD